jgi:RNA polymerase sigma-70 factor, ECF subfamily
MASVVEHPPTAVESLPAVDGPGVGLVLATAPSSRELAGLIYESAALDEGAFVELYDATATRVYGLAARILRSPTLAEDAALETYLEVWRTSARFRADQCSPIAWMLAIVLRRIVDRLDWASDAVGHPSRVPTCGRAREPGAEPEEAAHILEALSRLGPGELAALESACRDDCGADHAETLRLSAILSTLVSASLSDDPRRVDGTTYSRSLGMAPGRGVSGDF